MASNVSNNRDPNIPSTSLSLGRDGGCIKFVPFLPSEIASSGSLGMGSKPEVTNQSMMGEEQASVSDLHGMYWVIAASGE